MLDYSFQLTAPLKAGRHVIRVDNVGADPHHVLLFKRVVKSMAAHSSAVISPRRSPASPPSKTTANAWAPRVRAASINFA
jgi:hypothetical protein